jgi:multicomponent Na+:H+ antiporter subunit B
MTSSFLRLRVTVSVLVALLAMLSVFMLARGHHAPGGGFAGGLLFAAAIAIQLLAGGSTEARRMLRVDPRTLVGAGAVLAALATCLGLVTGHPPLTSLTALYVTGLGRVGTVLLFDIGVYLIVAGTALSILLSVVEDR